MKLFDKLFEKRAQRLGYVKEEKAIDLIDDSCRELEERVTISVALEKDFDPRITELEERADVFEDQLTKEDSKVERYYKESLKNSKDNKELILSSVEKLTKDTESGLEIVSLALKSAEKDIKKDIKKLSELFEAVSQIRKECEQIKVLEKDLSSLTKKEIKTKEEVELIQTRLNQISKATADIPKIEKAAKSFDTLNEINEHIKETEKKITTVINKDAATNESFKKDFQRLERRFSNVRVNGLPLTPNTEIMADHIKVRDTDLSLESVLQLRFLNTFKEYREVLDKDYKEKQIPFAELKQDIKKVDDRVTELTQVNRRAGKPIMESQKSFNELFRQVVEGNKKEKRELAKKRKLKKQESSYN